MLRSIVLLRLLQDKLSYITDVAMREQRLPRKAGSGTLWDRCGRSRRRCGAGRGADVAAAVLHYRTGGLSWHHYIYVYMYYIYILYTIGPRAGFHGTVAAAGMS